MRLTRTQILAQHLRYLNLVGSTDTNILADFNTNFGQRYQLALAKLANYRTVMEYAFTTGIQVTLLSSGVAQTISGITSSSTTATVTTAVAHGYSTSNSVMISGADPNGYNGVYTITVTSTTTFTYTLSAAIATAAKVSAYIPYPQGEVNIEGMYITVGSVNFPLQIISSRQRWNELNAIMIQASAIPQFYFPRRDDVGIWPIPQTVYTGSMSYTYRDRNLSVDDFATGTITLTKGSNQVSNSGGTFTSAMVGRWLTVTDPAFPGQGYWTRITGYVSSSVLTMYNAWVQATGSPASFLIGETPEIPEEGHEIFAWGTAADYYGGMQKDPKNAALYDNMFWTGNPSNGSRVVGDSSATGGLIGLLNRYNSRDDVRIIKKKPHLNPLEYKVWSTRLS